MECDIGAESRRVKHALQLYPLWNNSLLTPTILTLPTPYCTLSAPPTLSFLSRQLIAEARPFFSHGSKPTESHGFNQAGEAESTSPNAAQL